MSNLASNPFATRYVLPGQVAWIGDKDFFEHLVSRWSEFNGRASILGAHGSGKSTLLEHLVPLIGNVIWRRDVEGRLVVSAISEKSFGEDFIKDRLPTLWLQLRRTVPLSMVIPWSELHRGRLLVVDGYEQLGRWRRAALIARTLLCGVKLLVTSHRPTMLGALCELSISSGTAFQIISQLTAGRDDFEKASQDEVQQRLKAHDGNMRDVLMDLYDRFEEQRTK